MSEKDSGHRKCYTFDWFKFSCDFSAIFAVHVLTARSFLNIYQIFRNFWPRPFLLIMTLEIIIGYGVAFPKNSMWIQKFNAYLMRYRQNGDLERMQRFWFTGACDPREKRRTSSKPLALAQVHNSVGAGGGRRFKLVYVHFENIWAWQTQNNISDTELNLTLAKAALNDTVM